MFRAGFILLLVTSILCFGCRTCSPEVEAVWQKYGMVKPGMTDSEVAAILSETRSTRHQSMASGQERWSFREGYTFVIIWIDYGTDGRVKKIHREIDSNPPKYSDHHISN